MLKKLALGLGLALLPSTALAQNPTCPTRPLGDNTNACASTAFVQNALAAGLPLTHTHIYVGNSSNLAADFGALATFSDNGTLSINPTAASINQGIVITQSGVNSGSTTGSSSLCNGAGQPGYSYNSICLTGEALNVTTGSPPYTYAFSVGMATGGTNSQGSKVAMAVELNHNVASAQSPERDHVAFGVTAIDSASHGGTGTGALTAKGTIFAGGWQTSSSAPNMFTVSGAEIDVGIQTGGSSRNVLGWSMVKTGVALGDVATGGIDTAHEIACAADAAIHCWDKGITFSSLHGLQPIRAAGTLIGTDTTAVTVTNFIDFSVYACTGFQYKGASSNSTIDCSGNIAARVIASTVPVNTSGVTVTDGTASFAITPSTDFTHSIEISSSHLLVFRTGSTVIAGYFDASQQFNLGLPGTSHAVLNLNGFTSGTVSVKVQDVAGTFNWNLPTGPGTSGQPLLSGGGGSSPMTFGTLGVAAGGTNCTSASITCFNNITGFTASGTTGTTSTNLVFSASPTFSGTVGGAITMSGSTITFSGGTGSTSASTGTIVISGSGGLAVGGAIFSGGNQVITNVSQSGLYLRANGNASGFIVGRSISSDNAQNWFLYDEVATAQRLGVDSSGNFSITSGGLTVGGATITFTNLATDATHTDRTVCQDTTSKSLFFGSGAAGICLGTSSVKFKHDIEPLDAGLDQIIRLRAVSYRLNADHGDPDKLLYGFTAEQGAGVLPDLVGHGIDGRPLTFDYMGVVPVLVHAVQQLKADNDNLRAEIRRMGASK